jgi:SAM-dependent methyltransferase
MRRQVWRELDTTFASGDRVLELNCGTGVDAVHLAERGIQITACDISGGMIERARRRASILPAAQRPSFQVLPTEQLHELGAASIFDGAFSNFSGLNCVNDLRNTSRSLAASLHPGSPFLVCMLGKFVPWEIAWFLAQLSPRKATRRLRRQANATLEKPGSPSVSYYSRGQIVDAFAPEFSLRKWRGIGLALPPTYMECWAQHVPSLTRMLGRVDNFLGHIPPFRSAAGFMLLHFQRNP